MALEYLRFIQMFAEATGSRELFSAPAVSKSIRSFPIAENKQTAHFVYDVSVAKQVLCNSDIYLQDHFLDWLLMDCEIEKVRWLKLFVEKSPEFLDGISHTASRKLFAASIESFVAIASSQESDDIKALILMGMDNENSSAMSVAKAIVRLRFTQILEDILKTNISIDDDLLFGGDIFAPSIRMKSIVYRLNSSTNQFIKNYVPSHLSQNDSFILPILSLFYMASAPILASLVSFLNSRIESRGSSNADTFTDFEMVPTNFVAREAARDAELDGIRISKGDKLYVMLFESTGCPFSDAGKLPFGHGKHFCPGADLSRLILRQSTQAAETIAVEQWSQLRPSSILKGRASVFLTYEA
jgi:hypothetical protein